MSNKEEQEEELEVLRSIYDGDENFKEVSETVFQYKVGNDGDFRSFLVEVSWGENYPEKLPDVNLNAFYNKHISEDVKESVVQVLKEQFVHKYKVLVTNFQKKKLIKPNNDKREGQCDDLLGTAVTYTLFEYAKENAIDLMENHRDSPPQQSLDQSKERRDLDTDNQPTTGKAKEKKEQLTKAQKRRLYNRLDNKGEYPRGYDWIDIVKHLSQTGGQDS